MRTLLDSSIVGCAMRTLPLLIAEVRRKILYL